MPKSPKKKKAKNPVFGTDKQVSFEDVGDFPVLLDVNGLEGGTPVVIKDESRWRLGSVLSVKGSRVYVSYQGWDKRYDANFEIAAGRLRLFHE